MKYKGKSKGKGVKDTAEVPIYKPGQQKLVFSFKDFDDTQGQTFKEWQNLGLLNQMLDRLKEYSKLTRQEAMSVRFKAYEQFPANSGFFHPKHISQEAEWASMHIRGKECVIGHFLGNIFYVVFLDKDHKFWPSTLKNT